VPIDTARCPVLAVELFKQAVIDVPVHVLDVCFGEHKCLDGIGMTISSCLVKWR
jgi:hypothetical protein